ncbi:uncharacterized protein LOC122299678 isoform X1 [Carya illinoinensis]|uniref:N-acetyltransferase domain-containing protein n=2 Tax=Carya illinoinensis TaxID=32201 RepID=A0A8T1N2B8_CARIL|nr:uncharacterized protein LOC122299678 isoform X1 [Carya illinoinensis]KAG6625109.1 hypothetical protein CIPAW_16G073500 [Carya illinoinensis]
MAHLLANHNNILRRLHSEPSSVFTCRKQGRNTSLMDFGRSWRNAIPSGEKSEQPLLYLAKARAFAVHCSTSSADQEVGLVGNGNSAINAEGKSRYLVDEYGWKVRRLVVKEDEMRKAAQVQAEAFHEPVALFNDFFFEFFQAEVLSGLLYKLRNSPPNRYACLVTEPNTNASDAQKQLVGVVDVTVLRDKAVLEHLPAGAEEYLYVSGIAVLKEFRRQKIATVLLKACDVLSTLWGFEYLALRAYEDDLGARKLYASAGYQVVSGDPPWMSTWIGRKRRILMIKTSINLHA